MKQSIHKYVCQVLENNPQKIFTSSEVVEQLKKDYDVTTKTEIVTMILNRLNRKKIILRTPIQLATGFHYSHSNRKKLKEIYRNHLLPYDFENAGKLLEKIKRTTFRKLARSHQLKIDKESRFIKKYPLINFDDLEIKKFLAMITGFSMCDGHIAKSKISFFFRREADAILFSKDTRKIFDKEEFTIKKANIGDSYLAEPRRSADAARFIHKLGSPKGNKVFQPFSVPNWIYYGPDEIKKIFLSTIIGNEGSAPSKGRWRIQFVLSKCKEHVPNLLDFLNQIRALLYHFEITTSPIQLRTQKGRQFHGRFYIKGKENIHKFYNEFCFLYASEKQEVLEDLISKDLGVKNVMKR